MLRRIYQTAIVGGIGGLVAWYLIGLLASAAGARALPLRQLLVGLLSGAAIGGLLAAPEGALRRSRRRGVLLTAQGMGLGAAGGLVGIALGELASYVLRGGFLGRAFAWALLGLAIGFGLAWLDRSPRKFYYGAMGGGLGGGVGGLLFEALRRGFADYLLSQALGWMVLGACIGALRLLTELALRPGFLLVTRGGQEGAEFSLLKDLCVLGNDEYADIPIYDRLLSSRAAEIRRNGQGFEMRDVNRTERRIYVNGRTVTTWTPLKEGDKILAGGTILLFSQSRLPGASASPRAEGALTLLLLLTAALALSAPPAAAAARLRLKQVDRSRFPLVTCYFEVTERRRQTPLSARDVQAEEAGLRAEVLTLRSPQRGRPLPVLAALVMDRSGSMVGEPLQAAKDAARTFVGLMRPQAGDQSEVLAFNGTFEVAAPFSSDAAALAEIIATFEAEDGTEMYTPLWQAVSDLATLSQPGRKVVLLLSDGVSSRGRVTPEQIIERARERGVAIECIGLGGADEGQLRPLAEGTRGAYHFAPQPADLRRIYARIAGGLRREYALTYRSPNPLNDGTQRQVIIRLKGEEATIHGSFYRPGVVVPRSHGGLFLTLLCALLILLLAPSLPRRMGLKGRMGAASFLV